MRIYLRLLVAFLLLFAGNVYAEAQQEKRVTGTVSSEGEPLPGVSVQLKGASSGTITDIDGNYSIEAPVNGTLVFRFVGMRTVEQPVNNRNVINVTLESESKELEEVMVVAYATAKKYSFTGAASTMKAGEIEKLQTSSVSRVLEGTVSGVQASAASGQPYWSWYGFEGRVEWCACFVSWCADQCGYIESGIIPKFAGCVDGANWFKGNGQWKDRSYEPSAGDIIFFDWEGDGETDHVGIVEKCENGVVYTVEGNSGDTCRQNQYTVGSSSIYGYGVPAY